ncbi:MT-A70 family methyltransferase [Fodinicurvata sp. EGI_FJ10296]|uniref:MT-A70 family methyltransferase n=1 Tax=Fodinicurvata sp. EGI_FJ10296 TaxID=3231908 RepID=UPI00345368FF
MTGSLFASTSPIAPVAGEGPFGAILADPPWSYANFSAKGEARNPKAHYSCMSLADIAALPVADIAARDCALIMWATAPMMPQAFTVMDRWGFRFSTMGAWAKQSKTGAKWAFGTGYVLRSAAEFWLIGVRGKPRVKVRNTRNLIVAPVREHSRKPDEMRAIVERLFNGPYLELFARERAPGWDAWGNEIDKFTEPNPSPTVTVVTPQASHIPSHLTISEG